MDLTGLICPSDKSNRLGLSIPSDIVSPFEMSTDLVCSFCLMLDRAYLGPDGVIPYKFYVCPDQLKSFDFGKDTWKEAPRNYLSVTMRNSHFSFLFILTTYLS